MAETTDSKALELFKEGEALFSLLGRLIYGVPDRKLIDAFAREKPYEAIPFVDTQAVGDIQSDFTAWATDWERNESDRKFSELRAEYTRLFVGQRKVIAPLWESVYFNRDRMVFQEETFQVRSAYRRYGLQVDKLSHEPDDHLCYELLFIAALFGKCAEHEEKGNRDEAQKVWNDLRSFTLFHPLTWTSKWNDLVQENTQCKFYRGYAALVLCALKRIEEVSVYE